MQKQKSVTHRQKQSAQEQQQQTWLQNPQEEPDVELK